MPVNKRNWRKQRDHVHVMNTMKTLKKQLGESVKEGRPKGSGTAEKKVYEWRNSIQKDGKQIAIEIPDLILRRYASGGMIFTSQEKEKT